MKIGIGLSPAMRRRAGSTPDSLLSGQAAYWHLGSTADAGPNGCTLTNDGAVSFANDGIVAKCATFNGSNRLYVDSSAKPMVLFRGAAMAAGFLWRVSDTDSSLVIVETGADGNFQEFSVAILGNSVVFTMSDDSSDLVAMVQDTNLGDPGDNTWVQTFVWFDPTVGANGTAYIKSGKLTDSALRATVSAALSGPVTTQGDGKFVLNPGASGRMDEFGLYGRNLTAGEMARWFANVKAGVVPA